MPPPRTIHVDRPKMLQTIRQLAAEQRVAALERTVYYDEPRRQEVLAMAHWVPREVSRLAGKPLTPSERKRHQEALRAMADEGLVLLNGIHVRLTDAGVEAAVDA